jgi:hypothetical protein
VYCELVGYDTVYAAKWGPIHSLNVFTLKSDSRPPDDAVYGTYKFVRATNLTPNPHSSSPSSDRCIDVHE